MTALCRKWHKVPFPVATSWRNPHPGPFKPAGTYSCSRQKGQKSPILTDFWLKISHPWPFKVSESQVLTVQRARDPGFGPEMSTKSVIFDTFWPFWPESAINWLEFDRFCQKGQKSTKNRKNRHFWHFWPCSAQNRLVFDRFFQKCQFCQKCQKCQNSVFK